MNNSFVNNTGVCIHYNKSTNRTVYRLSNNPSQGDVEHFSYVVTQDFKDNAIAHYDNRRDAVELADYQY